MIQKAIIVDGVVYTAQSTTKNEQVKNLKSKDRITPNSICKNLRIFTNKIKLIRTYLSMVNKYYHEVDKEYIEKCIQNTWSTFYKDVTPTPIVEMYDDTTTIKELIDDVLSINTENKQEYFKTKFEVLFTLIERLKVNKENYITMRNELIALIKD